MALPFRCIIMQLWIYQAELYLAVRSIYDSLILGQKLGGGILDSRYKLLQDRILTVCLPGIKQTKVSLCIIALKGERDNFSLRYSRVPLQNRIIGKGVYVRLCPDQIITLSTDSV